MLGRKEEAKKASKQLKSAKNHVKVEWGIYEIL